VLLLHNHKIMRTFKIILLLGVIFLAGCGSATFDNFNLIGSAKDVEKSTIGKNDRVVYMADGGLNEICGSQAKLITDASWTASEELRSETTYKTGTFTKDQSTLTLMCSEQEENTGIKVTITLQK
jgi:hypothetical protein